MSDTNKHHLLTTPGALAEEVEAAIKQLIAERDEAREGIRAAHRLLDEYNVRRDEGIQEGEAILRIVEYPVCDRIRFLHDFLTEERDMFLYWLVRAYSATHRLGWEEGPTESETFSNICDVLANYDLDAENDKERVAEMLKRKPVFFVE